MSETYDLIVIGAGPGGYPAAIRGAQLGMKTACIEKELLGGVCLNWGCIPSKALLKTAEMAHKVRHIEEYGLSAGELGVDFPAVVERSRKVSKKFNRGVAGLFKKYGVTKIAGTASLLGDGQISVESSEGTTVYSAKHIVVATGARARFFPGMEPDGERILTYREAIVQTEQPESLIILGSGAIGMEFAYFMNAMGTKVTVIEGLPHLLPIEDKEVAKVVEKSFKKDGVTIQTGVFAESVENTGSGVKVTLKDGKVFEADQCLLALGITPNVEGIGLDAAGVKLERGFIAVDESYRTNVKGIYAVGDVASRGAALAHVATRQAHICVERIKGLHVMDLDDANVPSATYCQPQVGSVGMTEEAAKKAGLKFKVGKFPYVANGRMVGAGTPDGMVKVLIDDHSGEILGAHIVGADATEAIMEFVLARTAELDAETVIETVHAHPSGAEANLEAVAAALGVSVHI